MIDIEVLHRGPNPAERKEASPDSSYVSSLFHKGTDAICKKVAEEAPRPSWRPRTRTCCTWSGK